MAAVAGGFSALEERVQHVLALAASWGMGSDCEGIARGGAQEDRQECNTERGHHRQSIGEDHAKRGQRGYDAGKKVKGRKRHIAVDTLGLLLAVVVHSAGIEDRVGARALLIRLFCEFASIKKIFADSGYTGTLIGWCMGMFGWIVQIVKRTELHRFVVLPKRWIVERTFAWLSQSRRLSKDYEITVASAEAFIKISSIRTMLKHWK